MKAYPRIPCVRVVRRIKMPLLAVAFMSLCLGLLEVATLYNSYNAQIQANLSIPFKVFKLEFTEDMKIQSGLMCNSSCAIWNPSIVFYHGKVYVAARESTRQQCGGLFGFVRSIYTLTIPAVSSIVVGRLDPEVLINASGDVIKVPIETRVKDSKAFAAEAFHQGTEDPRFFINSDTLSILFTIETIGKPNMYSVWLKSEPKLEFSGIFWYNNMTFKSYHSSQKNWLHLTNTSRFLYSSNPLRIIQHIGGGKVDYVYAETEFRPNIKSGLRGSAIVEIPKVDDEKYFGRVTGDKISNSYLAISHDANSLYMNGEINFKAYTNYAYRLVKLEDSSYKITHVSEEFSIPTSTKSKTADRINYVTSIMLLNDDMWISFGSNDCTSHVAKFKTADFYSMLKSKSF